MSKLFVGSLSWGVTTEILRSSFERYGAITDAIVMMDKHDPTRSRGFGFVTFADPSCAQRALSEMDGQNLEGRPIKVNMSDGGGGGGGGGGSRWQQGGGRSGNDSYGRRDDNTYNNRSSGNDNNNRYESRESSRDQRDGGNSYRGRERDSNIDNRRHDNRRPSESHSYNRQNESDYGRGGGSKVTGGGGEAMRDPQSANNRIYITGLPLDAKEEEIAEFFGTIGKVARKRQKRGYPDQWPHKVSIYRDEAGKSKGDGTVTYEDPNAAQTAPDFFNGAEFKGSTLKVELAQEKEPLPDTGGGYGGRGGRGGYGGGGRGGGYGGGGRGGYGGRGGGRRY